MLLTTACCLLLCHFQLAAAKIFHSSSISLWLMFCKLFPRISSQHILLVAEFHSMCFPDGLCLFAFRFVLAVLTTRDNSMRHHIRFFHTSFHCLTFLCHLLVLVQVHQLHHVVELFLLLHTNLRVIQVLRVSFVPNCCCSTCSFPSFMQLFACSCDPSPTLLLVACSSVSFPALLLACLLVLFPCYNQLSVPS